MIMIFYDEKKTIIALIEEITSIHKFLFIHFLTSKFHSPEHMKLESSYHKNLIF